MWFGANGFATGEVGEGKGDFKDAGVGAGGNALAVVFGLAGGAAAFSLGVAVVAAGLWKSFAF